ncbi:hypothetical protein [Scytonema sp. PCC 10023]|uniref:hypothetical protein n=1 Tax=Scytonema sp. PCC 10023 TaxID=1680591 RepID=UPI0039C5AE3C
MGVAPPRRDRALQRLPMPTARLRRTGASRAREKSAIGFATEANRNRHGGQLL